jgi:DNA adenine methylase
LSPQLEPVIKWSGSKRRLAPVLLPIIQSRPYLRYFEPFVGGGSILGALGPAESFANDLQAELITLWGLVKSDPDALSAAYAQHWQRLQCEGYEYFYEVRDHFNATRSAESFLFLTRTCVNGLIRFNSAGDFNNSLHHTRPGIHPTRLDAIIRAWSYRLQETTFSAGDYVEAIAPARANDMVYLDPPYMGNRGRYQKQTFDFNRLWNLLEDLNGRGVFWVLSIDGSSGERDYTSELAAVRDLSVFQARVSAGNSPFPRLLNSRQDLVSESVLANFEPSVGLFREHSDDLVEKMLEPRA